VPVDVWQLNEKFVLLKAKLGLGTATRLASRMSVSSVPAFMVWVTAVSFEAKTVLLPKPTSSTSAPNIPSFFII